MMTSSPGVGLAVEPEHLRAVSPLRRAERHDLALARHVGHRHELGEATVPLVANGEVRGAVVGPTRCAGGAGTAGGSQG